MLSLQAPLSFLNAYGFRNSHPPEARGEPPPRLLVIEANAMVEIDYTGASVLADLIRSLARARDRGCAGAARNRCARRRVSRRLGLMAVIGRDHVFRSVQQAIDALAGAKGRS